MDEHENDRDYEEKDNEYDCGKRRVDEMLTRFMR